MKKLLLVVAVLITGGYLTGMRPIEEVAPLQGKAKVYPQDTNISFEVKNKSDKLVNVTVITDGEHKEIIVPVGETMGLSVDITEPSEIEIEPRGEGWPVMVERLREFSIPSGKTAYLTWDGTMLRPQGIPGKTDTGLSLEKNVTQEDVKKLSY